jgi:hypothetical protein
VSIGARLRELATKLGFVDSPTARSAKARLRQATSEFESIVKRTKDGAFEVFETANARPAPPESALSPDQMQLQALQEKANAISGFFVAFLGHDPGPGWSVEDLDTAFSNWLRSSDKKYYSKQTVIAITGAAFGSYLITHIGMRWLWITDSNGSAWGVRDSTNTVTGFPHHTVAKRIDASEYGFFRPVYLYLRELAREAREKGVA